MLLAQDFVLLALNPDGSPARGASNQPAAAVGVTGALVTELVHQGHVDLVSGRIHVTGSRPLHPLLMQALDNLVPHEDGELKSRLGRQVQQVGRAGGYGLHSSGRSGRFGRCGGCRPCATSASTHPGGRATTS